MSKKTYLLFILYFLSMGFALSQDDCGWIKRKNTIAKPSFIAGKSLNPWSSHRARVPRAWKVGSDVSGPRKSRSFQDRSNKLQYNVASVHRGRLVTCAFVGFFVGHTKNSGGGIEGMSSVNVGAATVALSSLWRLKGDHKHREGIIQSKLMLAFCSTVAYSLGHGIAQNLTPNHASIR